jgi:hypothetical protein
VVALHCTFACFEHCLHLTHSVTIYPIIFVFEPTGNAMSGSLIPVGNQLTYRPSTTSWIQPVTLAHRQWWYRTCMVLRPSVTVPRLQIDSTPGRHSEPQFLSDRNRGNCHFTWQAPRGSGAPEFAQFWHAHRALTSEPPDGRPLFNSSMRQVCYLKPGGRVTQSR